MHTQVKKKEKKKVAAYAKSFSFPAGITGLTGFELSDAEDVNGGHE